MSEELTPFESDYSSDGAQYTLGLVTNQVLSLMFWNWSLGTTTHPGTNTHPGTTRTSGKFSLTLAVGLL